MVYAGGEKIRASELNRVLPILGHASGDTSRTSTTTLADTDLAVDLEANALYGFEGYLAYDAVAAADIKFALAVPSGSTGHWGIYGLTTGATGSVGDLDARRLDAFGDANTQAAAGSDSFLSSLVCPLFGFIDTSGTAGELRVRVAQNTSNATASVLRYGSWLVAWRLD